MSTPFTVPDTKISVRLDEAFWRGELVPFTGPGADRGTLRRAAASLHVRQDGRDVLITPLEVQRVSGAGGLYLALLEQRGTHTEMRSTTFLGRNLQLIRLEHEDGIITVATVDARLGRPPGLVMEPGSVQRFRLGSGELLELE